MGLSGEKKNVGRKAFSPRRADAYGERRPSPVLDFPVRRGRKPVSEHAVKHRPTLETREADWVEGVGNGPVGGKRVALLSQSLGPPASMMGGKKSHPPVTEEKPPKDFDSEWAAPLLPAAAGGTGGKEIEKRKPERGRLSFGLIILSPLPLDRSAGEGLSKRRGTVTLPKKKERMGREKNNESDRLEAGRYRAEVRGAQHVVVADLVAELLPRVAGHSS